MGTIARGLRSSQRRAKDTFRFIEPGQAHPGVAGQRGDVDQQAIASGTHGIALRLVEHRLRVTRSTTVKEGAGQRQRAIGGVSPTRPASQPADSLSKVSNARRVAACGQLGTRRFDTPAKGREFPGGGPRRCDSGGICRIQVAAGGAVPPVHGCPLRGPRRARRRMLRGITIDDRTGP